MLIAKNHSNTTSPIKTQNYQTKIGDLKPTISIKANINWKTFEKYKPWTQTMNASTDVVNKG